MNENINKNITIIYSLFGDLTPVFNTGFKELVKEFPNPDYSVSNFSENVNQRESIQGTQIKSIKNKFTIKIYFNRVDFVFLPPIKDWQNHLEYINKFLSAFEINYNRLAINTSFLISDEKNQIKKALATKLLSSKTIGNETTEFSFKIGKIIHLGEEEINSLVIVEDGFIQSINFTSGIAIPSLKKALIIKTDVNTTQKNFTDRFSINNISSTFSSLYSETEKQVSTIDSLLTSSIV